MTLHDLADALTPTKEDEDESEPTLTCRRCGERVWEIHVWGTFGRWDVVYDREDNALPYREYGDDNTDTDGDDGWACRGCGRPPAEDQLELLQEVD